MSEITNILKGIDETELESKEGWWETSSGAEFGAKKLESVCELFENSTPNTEIQKIIDFYGSVKTDSNAAAFMRDQIIAELEKLVGGKV